MPAAEGLTAGLAGFAAGLRYEHIPPEVVRHATLCLLDSIGCGLYGSTLPWVRILRDTVAEIDDGHGAALWASGQTGTAPNAALVNGTAIHAFELDDLHRHSIVHPGSVVVSSALAAAAHAGRQRTVTGRDFVTAMVAGYEVAARVGMSMGAAHLVQGWHPTGTHGTLGAAAAAGSILGLGPEQMLHAIGTAGSQSAGLMSAQFSSMVKRLHAGHAASAGVLSALLARQGFLGIPDLLENSYGGYLSTFSPSSDPEVILRDLGTSWETATVGFKPYSTNGSCHPSIDALLAMRRGHGLEAAAVERVVIHCSTAAYKHVGWPYRPDTVTSAQMNLPYIVAVVLTDGEAFVDQFTPERITDPALIALSRRVHVVADPQIDAQGDAKRHLTRIEVVLRDGTSLRDERTHAKGSSADPLTGQDVEEKFFKLAVKALPDGQAGQVRDMIRGIETMADVEELAKAIS